MFQHQLPMIMIECQMDSGAYVINFDFHDDFTKWVEVLIALVVIDGVVVEFAVLFDELDGFDDVGLGIEE